MELLRLPLSLTRHKASTAHLEFEGWAAAFLTMIDAFMPTRILPGAFTKTIRENAKRIKILYQHNVEDPIGVPILLREEPRGLYLRGRLSSTARGQEVTELLRDGVISELSVGFDSVKASVVREQIGGSLVEVRHIAEVRLWEVSLVTTAANPDAVITAVPRRSDARTDVNAALASLDHQWADASHRATARRDQQVREAQLRLVAGRLWPSTPTPRSSNGLRQRLEAELQALRRSIR